MDKNIHQHIWLLNRKGLICSYCNEAINPEILDESAKKVIEDIKPALKEIEDLL